MFFEAVDLYRTLDLKSNPRNSSYFEMNFKRTINCPVTQANMNEHGKQKTDRVIIALWRTSLDNGEAIMRTSHLFLRN